MTSNMKDGVVLQGYHKKLKTMKKKYFVLCSENATTSARLEYYDSEKKFKSRSNPKRTIILKNCFNIFRRLDTKHKYVISLSMKDEGFCIVLDSEEELNKWLRTLLALQRGENAASDPPKPTFEHVWQVVVRPKGLAEERGILGSYYVCLTMKSLTLIPIGHDRDKRLKVDFLLTTIRRCGNTQCYFFMEVGRYSAFGAGELWMETADPLIAQNMHTMIINAMKNRDDNSGQMRKRSSSANETSKPISVMQMRQTNSSNRPLNSSPLSESPSATASTISSTTSTVIQSPIIKPTTTKNVMEKSQTNQVSSNTSNSSIINNQLQDCTQQRPALLKPLGYQRRHSVSGSTMGRERCDSLPSRSRTASDSSNRTINSIIMPPSRAIPAISNRPHSMYTNRHSHSPPVNTLSPSTGCSESEGSSLSIDETDSFGHSFTPDESGNFASRYYSSCSGGVIPEESCDDFWYTTTDNNQRNTNERGGADGGNISDKLNNHHSALSLPISANQNSLRRRGSPAASHHVGSVENQSQYMDMYSPYSPCGSSPCDQTGSNYMPISPGMEFSSRGGLYVESSGGHSRASSLADEATDGYVPMCAPTTAQDYVDMEQGSKQQNLSGFSSAASSCSITSGTPSTDVRFAEYPLDKVQSRFTPDDEDIQSNSDRPIRTYSVGSRLEHNKRKLRVDMLNAEQNMSRVRAFSVGSRAKVPRCGSEIHRTGLFHIMSHTGSSNNYNSDIMNTTMGSSGGGYIISNSSSGKNKKSSSAPILVHKSQSSVDRMSDLMEIDFSKNNENNSQNSKNNNNNNNTTILPSPVRVSSFPVQVPAVSSNCTISQFNNSNSSSSSSPKNNDIINKISSNNMTTGYVEMKPGNSSSLSSSEKTVSSSIKSDTSAPVIATTTSSIDTRGYLEMKPVGLSKSPSLSSSPIKSFSQKSINTTSKQKSSSVSSSPSSSSSLIISPKSKISGATTTIATANNDYINVSPPNSLILSRLSYNSNYNNNNDNNNNNNDDNNCHNLNPSRLNSSSSLSSNEKLMEIDDFLITNSSHHTFITRSLNTPEGYMEMSFNNGEKLKNNETNSLSSSTSSPTSTSTATNNEIIKHGLVGRSISSPIDIKSKDNSNKKGFELSSLSEAFSSTANYNNSNRYRTDSIDSNHITVTPTQCGNINNLQQSTTSIFPFSLDSPHKLPSSSSSSSFMLHNRKCLIDGTSGTLTISEDQNNCCSSNSSKNDEKYGSNNIKQQDKNQQLAMMITSKEAKILNTDIKQQQHQNISKCSKNLEALSNDYADMSLTDSLSEKSSDCGKNKKADDVNLSDYVNYVPQQQQQQSAFNSGSDKLPNISKFSTISNNTTGDYAIMKPLIAKEQVITTNNTTIAEITSSDGGSRKQLPITSLSGCSERTKTTFEGFKSIASSNDEMFLRGNENSSNFSSGCKSTKKMNSPKSMVFSNSNSNSSNRTQINSDKLIRNNNDNESGYELLQIRSDSSLSTTNCSNSVSTSKRSISRPNSVNSEKISPFKGNAITVQSCRPNSVNSECIISQSLSSSISTSCSTSTLCGSSGGGSSSSSSTLCGSKSQSPLTSSRPQSFSDTTITSSSTSRPDSIGSLTDQATTNVLPPTPCIVSGVVQSRPPSVSSERELHYASLDLPAASSNSILTSNSHHHHHCHQTKNSDNLSLNCCSGGGGGGGNGVGSAVSNNIVTKVNSSTSGESSTSPSPITSNNQQQPTFTYAQIDFNKSESLKIAMNAAAAANAAATAVSATTAAANNQ